MQLISNLFFFLLLLTALRILIMSTYAGRDEAVRDMKRKEKAQRQVQRLDKQSLGTSCLPKLLARESINFD
jgi:hypothetical protein